MRQTPIKLQGEKKSTVAKWAGIFNTLLPEMDRSGKQRVSKTQLSPTTAQGTGVADIQDDLVSSNSLLHPRATT